MTLTHCAGYILIKITSATRLSALTNFIVCATTTTTANTTITIRALTTTTAICTKGYYEYHNKLFAFPEPQYKCKPKIEYSTYLKSRKQQKLSFQMDPDMYAQSSALPNSRRFIVEDSITRVTSDGEPHGMMTMVAGLSGLLAAVIILAVLVSMVACRKRKTCCIERNTHQQQVKTMTSASPLAVAMTSVEKLPPQLAGNLNAAFAESTLSLSVDVKDRAQQKDKDNTWATTIVIERY